ncbi:MAG: hypothetical protein EOP84_35865 [Verrucomicrobiaceae bacterium]|nr:MAG: hypothetical protein EOP84_35865 [Verrucomicrobiaceae bacterium]
MIIDNRNGAYGSEFSFGYKEPILFYREMEERKAWILSQDIPFIAPVQNNVGCFVLYKFVAYEHAFAFQLKFRGTAAGRSSPPVEARWIG